MTKVPTTAHRIIIACDRCHYSSKLMSQAELDQFGTPWYCPECTTRMTKFTVGTAEELQRKTGRWCIACVMPGGKHATGCPYDGKTHLAKPYVEDDNW